VLVIGMHRSGTSAVTGALGNLGLALPAPNDLVSGRPDNPIHYESQALTDVDDALLRAWGGSWSAPPLLPPGWEHSATTLEILGRARTAAATAYPGGGPLAWKDPRLCLLLPFWRSVLAEPVLPVFVWRSPLAVARSLRARQSFTLSHGLALWDAYIRAALGALAGTEVFVVRFEDLLENPEAPIASVARWLDSLGGLPRSPSERDLELAAKAVSGRHVSHRDEGELPDGFGAVVETLQSLSGPHDGLPTVALPGPPLWAADAILQRHDHEVIYAKYLRYVKLRDRIPMLGALSRRRADRSRGTPR
jgi:hypothetical protein